MPNIDSFPASRKLKFTHTQDFYKPEGNIFRA